MVHIRSLVVKKAVLHVVDLVVWYFATRVNKLWTSVNATRIGQSELRIPKQK
jgi:hypothetical protein